jgi:hypothetical protein
MTKREYLGKEFYAWCQNEYDTARRALKNYGKVTSDVDRFLIKELRTTAEVFGRLI